MRTKSVKQNKINVVTLGCSKNIYDSEVLMGQLKANGKNVVHEDENDDGNIVVINTCGFIGKAKEESVDTILHYVGKKEVGDVDKVYVTGCLSERYKPDLEKEISDVDQYFGTHDLPNLLKVLEADYKHELIGERLTTTPKHYAYLKIAEGCDRPCSFCAIPLMRGKHRSTPIENIVKEAEKLAAKGIKEIMLIAQDLTYYGLDIYKKRALADLLKELVKVDGIEWIRLHYAFPTGFPMDVLEVMKKEPKVCNYLDIPLQHINTAILKSMKRGTTHEKTTALLKKFREAVPEMAIRTTLIVGYPGETEEQFQESEKYKSDLITGINTQQTSTIEMRNAMAQSPFVDSPSFVDDNSPKISYLNYQKTGQDKQITPIVSQLSSKVTGQEDVEQQNLKNSISFIEGKSKEMIIGGKSVASRDNMGYITVTDKETYSKYISKTPEKYIRKTDNLQELKIAQLEEKYTAESEKHSETYDDIKKFEEAEKKKVIALREAQIREERQRNQILQSSGQKRARVRNTTPTRVRRR